MKSALTEGKELLIQGDWTQARTCLHHTLPTTQHGQIISDKITSFKTRELAGKFFNQLGVLATQIMCYREGICCFELAKCFLCPNRLLCVSNTDEPMVSLCRTIVLLCHTYLYTGNMYIARTEADQIDLYFGTDKNPPHLNCHGKIPTVPYDKIGAVRAELDYTFGCIYLEIGQDIVASSSQKRECLKKARGYFTNLVFETLKTGSSHFYDKFVVNSLLGINEMSKIENLSSGSLRSYDLKEAEEHASCFFKAAIECAKTLHWLPWESPKLIKCFKYYASIARPKKAQKLFNEMVMVCKMWMACGLYDETMCAFNYVGNALEKKGEYKIAVLYFEKAFQLQRRILLTHCSDIILQSILDNLNAIHNCYLKDDNHKKSREVLQMRLDILMAFCDGSKLVDRAETLNLLARAYWQANDLKQATCSHEEALKYAEHLQINETQNIKLNLARLYHLQAILERGKQNQHADCLLNKAEKLYTESTHQLLTWSNPGTLLVHYGQFLFERGNFADASRVLHDGYVYSKETSQSVLLSRIDLPILDRNLLFELNNSNNRCKLVFPTAILCLYLRTMSLQKVPDILVARVTIRQLIEEITAAFKNVFTEDRVDGVSMNEVQADSYALLGYCCRSVGSDSKAKKAFAKVEELRRPKQVPSKASTSISALTSKSSINKQ